MVFRRYMPEGSAICSIASTAGQGYLGSVAKWLPLITTEGYTTARA